MTGAAVLSLPNPTLEELSGLDSGLILIVGGRRSGKTTVCEAILRCWEEQGANYRYFGYSPELGRWTGPRGRYGGGPPSSEALLRRCRGYRRILIDEPIHSRSEEPSFPGALVLATSNPQTWMTQRASWILWVSPNPEGLPLLRIEQGTYRDPSRISPTIWERLLIGVF